MKKLKGKKDPAVFETNFTADWTREEYLSLLGLQQSEEELAKKAVKLDFGRRSKGRDLVADAIDVDWSVTGKMIPVK